jgi:hypothetical protein
MHGKVFFSDGAYNYVCSGTALTSGNESVVWTAGHCVNEGPGRVLRELGVRAGLQGRGAAVRDLDCAQAVHDVGVGPAG